MNGYWERNDSGYTRGGLDVVTGINLFFKGILIFPILVLATYLGLAMVKHMIFQGVPSMSSPTEEQREMISDRDAQISTSVPTQRYPQQIGTVDDVKPVHEYEPYVYQYSAHGVPAEHYSEETLQEPVEEAWITNIEVDPFE